MNLPDKVNFLIIEDLVSDSFLIQRQLKKITAHPEIRFVDSEISLINAIKTFIPDFVITDFNLVGMDAFDVIRITKEYNKKIPVIVITAHLKNEADKERLLEAGASGFFLKEPVNELNERLLPLFKQIIEENSGQLDKLGKERKKYESSKLHSDFLREFNFNEGSEVVPKGNIGFIDKLRSLFSARK